MNIESSSTDYNIKLRNCSIKTHYSLTQVLIQNQPVNNQAIDKCNTFQTNNKVHCNAEQNLSSLAKTYN